MIASRQTMGVVAFLNIGIIFPRRKWRWMHTVRSFEQAGPARKKRWSLALAHVMVSWVIVHFRNASQRHVVAFLAV
jgi:hypothetical protein